MPKTSMPPRVAAIKRAIQTRLDFSLLQNGGQEAVMAFGKALGMQFPMRLVTSWQRDFEQSYDLSELIWNGRAVPKGTKRRSPAIADDDRPDDCDPDTDEDCDDEAETTTELCPACRGTGRDSAGEECARCGGSGRVDLDDIDDDDDDGSDNDRQGKLYAFLYE
jgi:hypothetical protein